MKIIRNLLLLAGIMVAIKSLNLLGLPLYLDEGNYIFWAKLMRESAGFAYLSLQDGKTPLYMWILAHVYPLFKDYFLTGRLISVIGAGITFFSWAVILVKTQKSKAHLWFWILMLVTPYTYLVERMAFVDSLMVAFASLSLLMSVLGRDKVLPSLLSGLFLALAFMTKSSARVFLLGQLAVSVFWIIEQIISKQYKKALFALFSFLLTYLVYSELIGYLRVGAYRFWAMIAEKEALMTFPISKILTSPDVSLYRVHLALVSEYAWVYLGGILLFIILGAWSIVRDNRKFLWLLAYMGIIVSAIFLSGKVTASRYFYMAVPALLVMATFGISYLLKTKKTLGKILIVTILLFASYRSLFMILAPLKAYYASDDQSYFVSGDISALGLLEIISYLKAVPPGIVGVSGIWGVAEGSVVAFQDADIEAVKITKPSLDPAGKDRYLYLTGRDTNLETIAKSISFTIEKTFNRPYSNSPVYLLKIQ